LCIIKVGASREILDYGTFISPACKYDFGSPTLFKEQAGKCQRKNQKQKNGLSVK
jgi:hypothetical protein